MALAAVCAISLDTPAAAAEMTFQLVNDTDRSLNLKLFSKSESHQQWPSKTRAYAIKPDAAVQPIKITCEEGEQICWGAWMTVQSVSGEVGAGGQRPTRTTKYSAGAGERGQRSCTRCCHVCKDGALTPPMKLRDPDPNAK
jgi:hypothetical protein